MTVRQTMFWVSVFFWNVISELLDLVHDQNISVRLLTSSKLSEEPAVKSASSRLTSSSIGWQPIVEKQAANITKVDTNFMLLYQKTVWFRCISSCLYTWKIERLRLYEHVFSVGLFVSKASGKHCVVFKSLDSQSIVFEKSCLLWNIFL